MQILSLKQFSKEQLQEMSLIEMAYELLNSQKQPASFKEIMDEITATLGLTEEEVRAKIAQFYTDLNIDGRFLSLGENRWGLRVWYPVDQSEEEVITPTKPKKKKKAKKVLDEDLEFEEDDDEDDIDYDDILADEDDDDLLDLDEDDEDFDEDFEDDDDDLLTDDDDEDDFDDLDDDLDEDEEEDL